MALYRNKYNPDLVIDPTQQDLDMRQGAGSDITFGEKLLNSGYALDSGTSGATTPKATTQKPVYANDLMAGRVDANGNPTIGQAYAGLIPGQNSDLESAYSFQGQMYKDMMNPVDENKIRSDTQARFQAEIDALNRIYAEKKAQERIAGQGRLGQATAVNARRGLIGSDFGTANIGAVETQNRQVQDAIDSELGLKLSGIYSKISQDAKSEAEAKLAARQQGAQQYIEFLKGASQRKEDRVNGTIANILGNNVEPDESMFSSIASQLGTTKEDIKAKYALAKVAYEKKVAEEAVKPVQVSAGAALVDPTTGKIIYQGETKQDSLKPVNLSPGETLVDPSTGKVIFTAPQKPTDNKPITQVVNKRLLQYNPETGTWSVVGAGGIGGVGGGGSPRTPIGTGTLTSPEVASWVKNIQDGTAKLTNVPAKLKNAVSVALANTGNVSNSNNELRQTALKSAKDLLNSFESGNTYAVGKSAFLPVLPGTDAQDFVNQYENLKSLLSLDNIKLLKGQGAVSDAERKLLADSSTKLNRNQTEGEFKKTLQELVATLSAENNSSVPIAIPVPSISGVESAKNKYGVTY